MTRRAPPKRLGRPRDGDSAETRERLLLVARKAFARKGYDSTTNKEIADGAGLTTGAIYHYYASKAELYHAVFEEVQDLVYSSFGQAVEGKVGLIPRFSAVLDSAVELNRHDASIAAFVVGVAAEAQRHPELAELLQPTRKQHAAFLNGLVNDAWNRGELANDVSLHAVEDLLNAMLSGLARFSDQTGDSRRHEAAVDALKRFFAGTLVHAPSNDP